jgi:hypothetical protein
MRTMMRFAVRDLLLEIPKRDTFFAIICNFSLLSIYKSIKQIFSLALWRLQLTINNFAIFPALESAHTQTHFYSVCSFPIVPEAIFYPSVWIVRLQKFYDDLFRNIFGVLHRNTITSKATQALQIRKAKVFWINVACAPVPMDSSVVVPNNSISIGCVLVPRKTKSGGKTVRMALLSPKYWEDAKNRFCLCN